MKLLRINDGRFELAFASREKDLLFHLLGLYPLVPASHHRLSKKRIPNQKENQQLLDEALQSHREANRKEIAALLNAPGRFNNLGDVCLAMFTRRELEWLLQVLNDVRIGSWLALGSPDLQRERRMLRDQSAGRHLMLMELAGSFEMLFLGIISGTTRAEAAES